MARFFVATALAAERVTVEVFVGTEFRGADFRVVASFAFIGLETGVPTRFATNFLAASFLAVAVLAPAIFPAALRLVAAFRAAGRGGASFRTTPFAAARIVLAATVFDLEAFDLEARIAVAFGRATLTSPRVARPDGRAFAAAAFTVGRRVDLLRGLEAMGSTLVTVAT